MIRVLIAHETPLIASVVASFLEDEAGIEVIGTASTPEQALARAADADVVVAGPTLGGESSTQLMAMLRDLQPTLRLLVLGVSERPSDVLPYVEAGADGYIARSDSAEALIDNIRAAYNNRAIGSPQIASALMSRLTELSEFCAVQRPLQLADELTEREMEVLSHLAQGMTNGEIADRLVIEIGTVKNHVHNILDKLNVRSRHDAAAYFNLQADDS
jgi:two-component system, NarL family, nitrate/nitrite response regulator NarL